MQDEQGKEWQPEIFDSRDKLGFLWFPQEDMCFRICLCGC